jgi:hypothetical protein
MDFYNYHSKGNPVCTTQEQVIRQDIELDGVYVRAIDNKILQYWSFSEENDIVAAAAQSKKH